MSKAALEFQQWSGCHTGPENPNWLFLFAIALVRLDISTGG
jgi:hypothetical protein